MNTALRALLVAALLTAWAPAGRADEGWSFSKLWPFGSSSKKEKPARPSAPRSTRRSKTPAVIRGVQQRTGDFFDSMGNAMRLGDDDEPKPVSGQTRRWKSSKPKKKEKPWYDFWSGEEKPQEPLTVQEFLNQDRPDF